MSDEALMKRALTDVLGDAAARIAALEATVARLTAPFGPADAEVVYRVNGEWVENVHPDYAEALFTAFLERRMKGC